MRIASAGNVGIGRTDPAYPLHITEPYAKTATGTQQFAAFFTTNEALGSSPFGLRIGITGAAAIANRYAALQTTDYNLADGGNIVMQAAGGKVGIGVEDPECTLEVESDAFGKVFYVEHSSGTNSSCYGMQVGFPNANPNDTSRNFIHCWDSVESKFIAYSDGSVGSAPNTYGGVSDERVKQDIRDSKSQWDDIKAIKVRNFKLKSEVFQYGDETPEHIGVIAQEVEDAGMDKLVSHHPPSKFQIENCDIEEDDTVKGMKYSILYMKAIKALQEAMERIEALENA